MPKVGAKTITILKNKPHKSSKIRKKNLKSARKRRQRGYHWEDTVVKRFNELGEWNAFRLGSPSVSLPDILAVSTKNSTIFTIEAKSGTVSSLPVPSDQIERCLKWAQTFDVYKTRKVILAFKFLSKKRIAIDQYESRQLREFFKVWDESQEIADCVCTYDGETYLLKDGKRSEIKLEDSVMPFVAKNQVFVK